MDSRRFSRREFLKRGAMIGAGVTAAAALGWRVWRWLLAPPSFPPKVGGDERGGEEALEATPTTAGGPVPLHEADYYSVLTGETIQCHLCFRECAVGEGGRGFCRNRQNINGRYYSLVYNHPSALHIDPIEKEPSFHMLPGGTIFCTGTASCNNRCKHCHNWHLSQRSLEELNAYAETHTPQEIVAAALRRNCDAVSFTYNEPTVFYEYMFDIARLAKESGLKALFHTNGSINPEPLSALLEVMDAVTVDLKAFTEDFYQTVSLSALWPVLRTLENIHQAGKHLEIVNLVIPTFNDDLEEIRRMCRWILENLGDEVPLHFTRFSPAYQMTHLPPTPIETLEAALAVADAEGLQYVYIGNVPGHERNSTFCPGCGKRIIHRVHFSVLALDVDGDQCHFCGRRIPGVWWPAEEGATEEG